MSTFIEIPIASSGATLTFPVPFPVIDATDIHVFIDDVELEFGAEFNVEEENTKVTLAAPPTGELLLIKRITPSDSKFVDFKAGAILREEDLDLAFDQVFNITQEVLDVSVHDFRAATEAFNNVAEYLPEIETVADDLGAGVLTHIDFGDLTSPESQHPHSDSIIGSVYDKLGDIETVATDLTKTTGSDVKTVADAITAVETVAAIKTAVENVSLRETQVTKVAAIDTKVTALAAIDSQIVTVNDNLPAILAATPAAVTASTKATEAMVSAAGAVLSAGAAAASESTATAQALVSSSASATAVAALDDFDNRYLGSKATAPVLGNDGDALTSGALYFNTTADVMNVYDGTVWVAAYASLSGAMMGSNSLSDVASASAARTNLGLVIGTDVHPYDGTLQGTLSSLQSQIDDNEVLILAGI